MQIDHLPLHSGSYKLSVWLGDSHQDYDAISDALTFDFVQSRLTKLSAPENPGPASINESEIENELAALPKAEL